jgi:hypothetical protein
VKELEDDVDRTLERLAIGCGETTAIRKMKRSGERLGRKTQAQEEHGDVTRPAQSSASPRSNDGH